MGDETGGGSNDRADWQELRRRAEADADIILSDAAREAAAQRRTAQRMLDQARRELIAAQEQALQVRAEANQRAEAIVEGAERRARSEADAILTHARRRLADVVEQTRSPRRLPLIGHRDPLFAAGRASDRETPPNVIDLRERISSPRPVIEEATVPDGEQGDQLDQMVQRAVNKAVSRAIRPPVIHAGRYA